MSEGRAKAWYHHWPECPGFQVMHYAAGTTQAKDVWLDPEKKTPASNPVVADASGFVMFYADGDYDLEIRREDGQREFLLRNIRITQDQGTIWEGLNGTTVPGADDLNKWGLFAKHDGTNFEQFYIMAPGGPIPVTQQLNGSIVNLGDYAVTGDGETDDHAAYQSALDDIESQGGGWFYTPRAAEAYMLSNDIKIGSNLLWLSAGGAAHKTIEGSMPDRGSVVGRMTGVACENNLIIGLQADANNQPINPIGFGSGLEVEVGGIGPSVRNIRVYGAVAKNAVRSDRFGGGKGLTFQRGSENCMFVGCHVENCAEAINTGAFYRNKQQGSPPPTIEYSRNVIYSDITVDNCGAVYSCEDFVSPDDSEQDTFQITVDGITARNCGNGAHQYSFEGALDGWKNDWQSTTGKGVFWFEGGTRIHVRNVVIHNSDDYPKIGALVRGRYNRCVFESIRFEGNSDYLFDGNNVLQSQQGAPNDIGVDWSRNRFESIDHIGSCDYVINCADEVIGVQRMQYNRWERIYVDTVVNGIAAPNAQTGAGAGSNWCHFVSKTTAVERKGILTYIVSRGDNDMSSTEGDANSEIFFGFNSVQFNNMRLSGSTNSVIDIRSGSLVVRLGGTDEEQEHLRIAARQVLVPQCGAGLQPFDSLEDVQSQIPSPNIGLLVAVKRDATASPNRLEYWLYADHSGAVGWKEILST